MLTENDINDFLTYDSKCDQDVPEGFMKVESTVLSWVRAASGKQLESVRQSMVSLVNQLAKHFPFSGIVYRGVVLDSLNDLNTEPKLESFSCSRAQAIGFTGAVYSDLTHLVIKDCYKNDGYLLNYNAIQALDLHKLLLHIQRHTPSESTLEILENYIDEREVLDITDYTQVFAYKITSENLFCNVDIIPSTEEDVDNSYHFTFVPCDICYSFYQKNDLIALANITKPFNVEGVHYSEVKAIETMEEGKGQGTAAIHSIFTCMDIHILEGDYIDIAYDFWHRLGATKEDGKTPIAALLDEKGYPIYEEGTQAYFMLTRLTFLSYWEDKRNKSVRAF